jgi:hypothetical protein
MGVNGWLVCWVGLGLVGARRGVAEPKPLVKLLKSRRKVAEGRTVGCRAEKVAVGLKGGRRRGRGV